MIQMGKKQQINDQLESLLEIDGVDGAAIVRADGLLIASKLADEVNDNQVGAMTASAVGSGKTASQTLGLGEVEGVTIKSADGNLVSMGAGDDGILTLITSPDADMGSVRDGAEESREALSQLL